MPTTAPFGQAYAVPSTQLGIGRETSRGTAATPGYWLPINQPKYKPDLTLLPDKTLQGSMVSTYATVPGMRYDSHGWTSHPYLDSFGNLVEAELGTADTFTAAGANTSLASSAAVGATTITTSAAVPAGAYFVLGSPGGPTGGPLPANVEVHYNAGATGTTVTLNAPLVYAHPSGSAVTMLNLHQWSLLNNVGTSTTPGNQPPSYSIYDWDGEEWRLLTAAQLDKLSIKGTANGLVEYTCDWFANPAVTPTAPTPSYSGVRPPPSWTAQAVIGGNYVQYIEEWEFDFARGVKPIPALTGTQQYFQYFAGPLTATGKMTFIEPANSAVVFPIGQYEAGTIQSMDFTMYDFYAEPFASGTPTTGAITIHSTLTQWQTAELTRSKEWVEATMTFEFLPSAADTLAASGGGVSPVKVTIANSQSTAY